MTEQEARKELRKLLKRGDTVYTNLHHVSRSGMMRKISCHIVRKGRIRDITRLVSDVTGFTMDVNTHALRVSGVGMDMGFHVVYSLSRSIFKDTNKGDAGYALNHEWI